MLKSSVLILLVTLAGCLNLSPQIRWQHADQLVAKAAWEKLLIPTDQFTMSAYIPKSVSPSNTLTIYIEGDGLAWLNRATPSDDPTPRNPIGLKLALRHTAGAAAYLARPCQYIEPSDARNCQESYWTNRRFAPEVIESSDQAISVLKQRFAASKLVLVGYSGGGAVAALVTARRNDVIQLITVAGNLDHHTWTTQHHVLPLVGSLNPADEWQALTHVAQLHLVGAKDNNISRSIADAYASRFPRDSQPRIISLPGFDHSCCWVEQWPDILSGNLK